MKKPKPKAKLVIGIKVKSGPTPPAKGKTTGGGQSGSDYAQGDFGGGKMRDRGKRK